ncbi:MAG TPA: hypothetical protein VGO92_03695 [Acidimicrobiales bacterium]|jgi:hypothetical protein|nr:hypothetical protein [Acidimicrobiales bacterium]
MRNTVLLSIAVAWSGIQFGTLWIMQTSILPLLNTRGDQDYIDTCQGIDMHFFHPIALWGGVLMMVNGLFLATQVDDSTAKITCAVAAAMMLGVGIVSEGKNRPIWRMIEKWKIGTMPGNWLELRRVWSLAHSLRTAFAFLGVVFFTLSLVLETT